MGNKLVADRISNASKVNLVSRFNIEDLIDDSILESIYEQFKSQSGVYVDDEAFKVDFTEFNDQKNEFLSDLIKERVIKEINEAITTGFSTPGFFIEELKEPSKFFLRKYPNFCPKYLSNLFSFRIRKM
jgi:hypothetical protein